jgi:hypothetical protein
MGYTWNTKNVPSKPSDIGLDIFVIPPPLDRLHHAPPETARFEQEHLVEFL